MAIHCFIKIDIIIYFFNYGIFGIFPRIILLFFTENKHNNYKCSSYLILFILLISFKILFNLA